jgi:hypothetical protein
MELKVGSQDHMQNEFFSYRYSTRFQKGELVEIKVGFDLEYARFQARKSFPEVLNEYWWLKPSDVPALKNIPLKVSDIFFYHGGIPVLVLVTASGTLTRKAQVFIKKKEEYKPSIEPETLKQIELLDAENLSELLHDQNLLIRLKATELLTNKFPDFSPSNLDQQIIYKVLKGNFDDLIAYGKDAIDALVERFFITTNAKEIERILDTIIAIGPPALPKLEGISDFLSILASPYYAKRINWTIEQINKKIKGKGAQK